MTSILQRVRNEAYREGHRQGSMLAYDDAEDRGRLAAQREAPRRWVWFFLGAVVGSGSSMLGVAYQMGVLL